MPIRDPALKKLGENTAIEILGQGVQTRVFQEILEQLGAYLGDR
jgi:hypothetical protein